MVVMVTGFEPFGEDAVNPTQEIVNRLPERIGDARIEKLVLPVEFFRAPDEAEAFAWRVRPDAVLCLGLAGGRDAVTPERTAVNVMDARIPDNAGFKPSDEAVCQNGPAAYFTTLPVREMIRRMTEEGIPAKLSESAGTYVCNCLMYRMLRSCAEQGRKVPCGFVHVPYLDTMGKEGSFSLGIDVMVRAVSLCVEAVCEEMQSV